MYEWIAMAQRTKLFKHKLKSKVKGINLLNLSNYYKYWQRLILSEIFICCLNINTSTEVNMAPAGLKLPLLFKNYYHSALFLSALRFS